MVPLFARAFAFVALSFSSAAASSNEEHCDETSLVQLSQKVRLASEHRRYGDGTSTATATDLRMEIIRRAFVARLAWEKTPEKATPKQKTTPKHEQSIDENEIDKDSAEELALVKMAYKRRLIEREITDKEIEFNKAAAKAKIAEGQAALDKVQAKALEKVKEAEAKARVAKAKWEETLTKNAGLDDPGDLKTVAEKKAARKLEKTLTDEWEAEHGKANAKRTAAEMGARQQITVQDYFADMADVERLTADSEDSTEVEDFSKKVAQRTAAEKAAVAKITQMNYAADTAAAAEVDAIEAKVNAQLMDEEHSINKQVAPAQKKTAVKQVHSSSQKAADKEQHGSATLASSKAAQEEDAIADDKSSKDEQDEPAQDDGAEHKSNSLKSLMKTFNRDDD